MPTFWLTVVSLLQVQLAQPGSTDEEVELALSAAPAGLRADAGVFVLAHDGFARHRDSGNGVECLVERGGHGSIEPICWDAEGADSLLPVTLEKAQLRARGIGEDDIEAAVAEGYESGRFHAPRRAGVAYMLSVENHVWNGEQIVRYHPHIMVYAPYVTNEDIGSDGSSPWMPWVLNEGRPNAYIVTVTREDE